MPGCSAAVCDGIRKVREGALTEAGHGNCSLPVREGPLRCPLICANELVHLSQHAYILTPKRILTSSNEKGMLLTAATWDVQSRSCPEQQRS